MNRGTKGGSMKGKYHQFPYGYAQKWKAHQARLRIAELMDFVNATVEKNQREAEEMNRLAKEYADAKAAEAERQRNWLWRMASLWR